VSDIYISAAVRSLGEFFFDRKFWKNFLSNKKAPHHRDFRRWRASLTKSLQLLEI